METKEKIRRVSVARGHGGNEATFAGMQRDECDALLAAMMGGAWIRVDPETGRLMTLPAYQEFIEPLQDPFWAGSSIHSNQTGGAKSHRKTELLPVGGGSYPALVLTHLEPYGDKRARISTAQTIQDWGFVCLRSRRNLDGRFWEVWYLPDLWAAKGQLATQRDEWKAEKLSSGQISEMAADWIAHRVRCGTINVVSQRWGLSCD